MKEKEGLSFDQISKRFGVSKRAVFNWTKSLYPKVHKNRPCLKNRHGTMQTRPRIQP